MIKEPVELLSSCKVEQDIIKLKWKLIKSISDHMKANNMTQVKLAKALGVSQPRVSKVLNGQVGEFRVDCLIRMNGKLGLKVINTDLI